MKRKNVEIVIFVFVIASLIAMTVACQGDDADNALSVDQTRLEYSMATTPEPPVINHFTISPEIGLVGNWFLFTWETEGADRVTIEPTITSLQLPPAGSVAGKVIYSTWFTLIAETSGVTATARAWVQVSHPEGSTWGFPRADTSNSNFSRWPGPLTNNLKWTFPLLPFSDSVGSYISLTLGGDDSVYVSENFSSLQHPYDDDYLCVINPDGTKKFDKYAPVSQQVIDSSGTIYGSSNNQKYYREKLIALNPDGTEKWVFDYYQNWGGYFVCQRQIYLNQQGNLVVFDSNSNEGEGWQLIYEVSSTGAFIRDIFNAMWGTYGLAINADGSIVVEFQRQLYCFSGSTDKRWMLRDTQLRYYGTPITDMNRRIYTCFYKQITPDGYDSSHGVMAIDHRGHEIWRVFFPDAQRQTGAVMARSDRAVYVVLVDIESDPYIVSLCAIHLGGWLLWTVPIGEVSNNPYGSVVVDGDDRTYVSQGRYLYSFDRDGSLCWKARPGGHIADMALSRDGTLYAADWSHVFAFGDDM